MRKKRPHVASLAEVRIRREGDDAVIEYADETIATTYFRIGPAVHRMSDQEILGEFNATLVAEGEAASAHQYVAVEIPPGRPQIRRFETGRQWVPRGSILRCVVDDGGPDGEAVVYIDDQELSLAEFGRLLCAYAGWGMRITFVPEDRLDDPPHIERAEPDEEEEEGDD